MKRGHTIQQTGNSQAFPYLRTASRHHGVGAEWIGQKLTIGSRPGDHLCAWSGQVKWLTELEKLSKMGKTPFCCSLLRLIDMKGKQNGS